ncbi:MAG: hypothetical protein ABW002_18455 [Xanthomonas sp.]
MSGLTDFHVFWGVAMTVAEAQSASVEQEFASGLYGEYLAHGSPKNSRKWLSTRLENAFVCLHEKPVWIGEPAWAYHQGQPMVFLHQVHVPPSAQHIKEKMALGDTVYLFGSNHRLQRATGEIRSDVYRTVVQTLEGHTAYEILE